MLVALGFKRHLRQNADAQSQFHIGLDDIRIYGRKHNVGNQSLCVECLIDFRAAGKSKIVSNDRI